MKPATIVACLALFSFALAAEEEHHEAFCYSGSCGPESHLWTQVCHEGQRQTPVDIPANLKCSGIKTRLRLIGAYKGNSFRIQNSGHSVSVDFVGESGQNEGPAGKIFTFPDPLNMTQTRDYKFASAHFHWGKNNNVGSEHTVGGKSTAMEAHFVHYLASYPSLAEAVASGDENALNVLGLFIDVPKNLFGSILSLGGNPSLAPIVNNLDQIHHASHDGGFVTVNRRLDFTSLLLAGGPLPQVYSYKGSLTTPGCNEQVNWFVLKTKATVPASQLNALRTKLMDGNGVVLNENHRPIMPLNGRKVLLHAAVPTM
jgi:carbonic anhydrase